MERSSFRSYPSSERGADELDPISPVQLHLTLVDFIFELPLLSLEKEGKQVTSASCCAAWIHGNRRVQVQRC